MTSKPHAQTIADLIRAACRERGWGPTDLARAVGRDEGSGPGRIDRQYARKWMTGDRTPGFWWPHVARVLDLDPDLAKIRQSRAPAPAHADTVASVIELGRNDLDVDRRNFLTASSGYALAALGLPDPESITRRVTSTTPSAVRVGRGEVEAIKVMVRTLGDSASELGGGHARHLAVRYLTEDVAPWLNGKYTEATGKELFAATSQLTHLAGWMAQDEGDTAELQGIAQGYYAHAYRLADEAGDPELAGTALRGLAVQCIDLGYRAEAVQLSEACVHYGRTLQNPRAVAYYNATLANAAAQDNDRTLATQHLALAETAIGKPSTGTGDSWAAHYSPGRWAHETGMIHTRLGDLTAAEEHLRLALEIHGLDRRRTRAIVLADLGGVRLRQGNVDGAMSTWADFLDCADGVRSVKVRSAIQDMRVRLRRFPNLPQAQELRTRAAAPA
ncbi:tetratricopeptide repeat protein [Streptomyces sp. NPDC006265]|uniref:tetratricopeptide repeat protein n=1 Tax=Streptomyces sp. NPDC006265 TaxID=3156740 RepID=UPI0033A9157A